MTRPTAFGTVDPPEAWPRLRGSARPERLQAPLDSLAGVGPRIAAKLRKLGLVTVRDLLEHRPRDYQRSVGESRIVDLFAEQEAVISGQVRNVSLRRTRGRLTVLTAVIADESGSIPCVWFNQDWLKEKLLPGTSVRLRGQAPPWRLQRQVVRRERRRAHGRLRAGLPGGRGDHAAEAAGARRPGAQARPERARPAAGGAEGPRGPAAARGRAPRPPPAANARGGGGGAAAARVRRAARCSSSRLRGARASRGRGRAGARRAGRAASRATARRCRSRSPSTRSARSPRSTATSRAPCRCSGCSRATSARGRPWLPCTRCCARVERGRQGALMAPTETLAEQHFLTVDELCARSSASRAVLLTGSSVRRSARR